MYVGYLYMEAYCRHAKKMEKNGSVLLQPGSWFVTKDRVHTVFIRKINSLFN